MPFVPHYFTGLRRSLFQSLAGEEGLEPPYPVLETGVLTIGRLPFTLSPPKAGEGSTRRVVHGAPDPTSEPAQTSCPGSSPLLLSLATALPSRRSSVPSKPTEPDVSWRCSWLQRPSYAA